MRVTKFANSFSIAVRPIAHSLVQSLIDLHRGSDRHRRDVRSTCVDRIKIAPRSAHAFKSKKTTAQGKDARADRKERVRVYAAAQFNCEGRSMATNR